MTWVTTKIKIVNIQNHKYSSCQYFRLYGSRYVYMYVFFCFIVCYVEGQFFILSCSQTSAFRASHSGSECCICLNTYMFKFTQILKGTASVLKQGALYILIINSVFYTTQLCLWRSTLNNCCNQSSLDGIVGALTYIRN